MMALILTQFLWLWVKLLLEDLWRAAFTSDWGLQSQTAGIRPISSQFSSHSSKSIWEENKSRFGVFLLIQKILVQSCLYFPAHEYAMTRTLMMNRFGQSRSSEDQTKDCFSPSIKQIELPTTRSITPKNNTSRKQTNLSPSGIFLSASCNIYIWNQERRQFQNWHFLGLSPGSPVTILYRISFHQYSIQHLLLPSSLPSQQYSKVLRTSMYIFKCFQTIPKNHRLWYINSSLMIIAWFEITQIAMESCQLCKYIYY